MPKKIKVFCSITIELPDEAEIMRVRDPEEGDLCDHIKVMGKLIHPVIEWMEFESSDLADKRKSSLGMGWHSVNDEMANYLDDRSTVEEWYMEEIPR